MEKHNTFCAASSATNHSTRVSSFILNSDVASMLIVCSESTLKRHGYYCRSRKAGPIARSRSCIACVKRKARCDNKRPECSRCMSKGIRCQYPAKSLGGVGNQAQNREDVPAKGQQTTPSLVIDAPEIESLLGTTGGDALLVPELEPVSPKGAYFAWDDPNINFAEFLDAHTMAEAVPYSWFRQPSSFGQQTFQQAISSFNAPAPAISTSSLRSLHQRPKPRVGTQRIANLILYNLKSYPLMMMRHNTLPPFIHPRLVSFDFEKDSLEPLTNCISLVHMISSGMQSSRKLFWKNVRMECERLSAEVRRIRRGSNRSSRHADIAFTQSGILNQWELLAGLQALSIYILIRLDEGETEHNNLDSLLLRTVTVSHPRHCCPELVLMRGLGDISTAQLQSRCTDHTQPRNTELERLDNGGINPEV